MSLQLLSTTEVAMFADQPLLLRAVALIVMKLLLADSHVRLKPASTQWVMKCRSKV